MLVDRELAPTRDLVVRDVAGSPAREVVALSRPFRSSSTRAFVDAIRDAARAVEAERPASVAASG